MERLYSKIVGSHIYEDSFERPISTVKDIIIDPESGKVLALVVNLSRNLVLSPIDILSWNDAVHIHSRDDFVPGDEILRVDSVQKMRTRIFHNKVYTKEGEFLGKVADFSIDSSDLALNKLYVSKVFWGVLRYQSRIIPAKNIEEILPDKIVVKADASVKEEEKVPATDLAVS